MKKEDRTWDIEIYIPNKIDLEFKVKLAIYKIYKVEYDDKINKFLIKSYTAIYEIYKDEYDVNVNEFFIKSHTSLIRFNRLVIDSYGSIVSDSEILFPRKRLIYV